MRIPRKAKRLPAKRKETTDAHFVHGHAGYCCRVPESLYAAGHDICAVYTRRDKPVGRKQVLTAPPVKEVALAHGTPVFQPRTLRDGSEDENIRALAPELIVGGGLWLHPAEVRAGNAPLWLHQPARFAAAEISRQRPGAVVGAER
mgnify:CR=1 FL=1